MQARHVILFIMNEYNISSLKQDELSVHFSTVSIPGIHLGFKARVQLLGENCAPQSVPRNTEELLLHLVLSGFFP